MEKLLIFIKHNFRFLWQVIEWGNGVVFHVIYSKKLNKILDHEIEVENLKQPLYHYKRLNISNINTLVDFFAIQPSESYNYFKPHGFTKEELMTVINNPSFVMMGLFVENKLVGYFFLRFFFNGKCFIGRIVDVNHRRKGLAALMNNIMYNTVWKMKFRCLSTISRNNGSIVEFHKQNPNVRILKELSNNYLLIEVVQNK